MVKVSKEDLKKAVEEEKAKKEAKPSVQIDEQALEGYERAQQGIVKGEWKNEMQARYADVLNRYAVQYPEKFKEKKDILMQRLEKCGEDEDYCRRIMGIPKGESNIKVEIRRAK